MVQPALDTLHLNPQLVEPVLLARNLVLKLRLSAVQVTQLRLVPAHDLLLILQLLLQRLNFSPEALIPIAHLVNLREHTVRFRALLLIPFRQLFQLLVLHDQIRLQIILLLLERCALLSQRGSLLLQLGKLSP